MLGCFSRICFRHRPWLLGELLLAQQKRAASGRILQWLLWEQPPGRAGQAEIQLGHLPQAFGWSREANPASAPHPCLWLGVIW